MRRLERIRLSEVPEGLIYLCDNTICDLDYVLNFMNNGGYIENLYIMIKDNHTKRFIIDKEVEIDIYSDMRIFQDMLNRKYKLDTLVLTKQEIEVLIDEIELYDIDNITTIVCDINRIRQILKWAHDYRDFYIGRWRVYFLRLYEKVMSSDFKLDSGTILKEIEIRKK